MSHPQLGHLKGTIHLPKPLSLFLLTISNYGLGYIAYSQMIPAILLWGFMLFALFAALLTTLSLTQTNFLMEAISRFFLARGITEYRFTGDLSDVFLKGYVILSGVALVIGEIFERVFPNAKTKISFRSKFLFLVLVPLVGYACIFLALVKDKTFGAVFVLAFFYVLTVLTSLYALGIRALLTIVRKAIQALAEGKVRIETRRRKD